MHCLESVACGHRQVNARRHLQCNDDHSRLGYLFVQYPGFCLKNLFGTTP
jgi:hypothetical protein